jgi:hypothetical protein
LSPLSHFSLYSQTNLPRPPLTSDLKVAKCKRSLDLRRLTWPLSSILHKSPHFSQGTSCSKFLWCCNRISPAISLDVLIMHLVLMGSWRESSKALASLFFIGPLATLICILQWSHVILLFLSFLGTPGLYTPVGVPTRVWTSPGVNKHFPRVMWLWLVSKSRSLTPFKKYLLIYLGGTGVWTQGLYLELLHQPFFLKGIFQIRSCKLFAWAGFEPWSSWSLPSG